MDLADEAAWACTDRADPSGHSVPATAIADLARTDAEVVFVMCHEPTIGGSGASGNRENAIGAEWRRNTCASEGAAISRSVPVATDGARTVDNKEGLIRGAATALHGGKADPSKTMCRQSLRWQSDTYDQAPFVAPIVFSIPREFRFEAYAK